MSPYLFLVCLLFVPQGKFSCTKLWRGFLIASMHALSKGGGGLVLSSLWFHEKILFK